MTTSFFKKPLALAVSASLFCSAFAMAAAVPADRDVLPAGASPQQYQLTIDPDLQKLSFQGELTLDFTASQTLDELVLNALDLTIIDASIDGNKVNAEVVAATQRVHFKTPVSIGTTGLGPNQAEAGLV